VISIKLAVDATWAVQTGRLAALTGHTRPSGFEKHRVKKQGVSFMGIESIIVWLVVGAIAGWLAGLIVKGAGFGLVGNIVIGIIGAVVAGWLLPQLGVNLGSGIVAAIIDSAIGGIIVLVILSLIRRA
jgi:uncharacterized membrane protein YeaQ/YmgE (transglycosylase-associated protein family)